MKLCSPHRIQWLVVENFFVHISLPASHFRGQTNLRPSTSRLKKELCYRRFFQLPSHEPSCSMISKAQNMASTQSSRFANEQQNPTQDESAANGDLDGATPEDQTHNNQPQVTEDESSRPFPEEFEDYVSERKYNIIDDVEDIELYAAGGFHPVDLGDELHNGRFTIIHKLGFGGYSTVWLARDRVNEKYVTLKVGIAQASEDEEKVEAIHNHLIEQSRNNPAGDFLCLPSEKFLVEGPNGTHPCTVFPVCGPSIATVTNANMNLRNGKVTLSNEEARRAAFQATQALAFLHSEDVGIGHGDLTSANVLLDISNFDHLSPEQLYEVIGSPYQYSMSSHSDEPLPPSAPRFVVDPIDPLKLFKFRTGNIKIIDFGCSYRLSEPPTGSAIPVIYRSPELILNQKIGKEGDVWALGCVIYEIRTQQRLFRSFFETDIEVAESMRDTLRPFSREMLTEETLELEEAPAEDVEDELLMNKLLKLTKPEREPWYHDPDRDYAFKASRSTGLKKVWNYVMWAVNWRPSHAKGVLIPAIMSRGEADGFHGFLSKTLSYDVAKRPTAMQICCHPWFSKKYEEPSQEE